MEFGDYSFFGLGDHSQERNSPLLVNGWFGFNSPLRQYFSLYQAALCSWVKFFHIINKSNSYKTGVRHF